MPLRLKKLVRQLTSVLVVAAFVVAAFGPGLSTANAAGSTALCAAYASADVQDDNDMVQGRALDQSAWDSPHQKNEGARKSPCCSGICPPAVFSFPDHNAGPSAVNKDGWQTGVQALMPADTGNLKRPPRSASSKFARA